VLELSVSSIREKRLQRNTFSGTFQGLTMSPEAAVDNYGPLYRTVAADWTSPVRSGPLLEPT
jgi:hypothetical protein